MNHEALFASVTHLRTALLATFGIDLDEIPGGGVTVTELSASGSEVVPLRELGRDPVSTGSAEKTPIQDAFTENSNGESKMDKATAAVKDADGMIKSERDAYDKAMAEAQADLSKLKKTTVGESNLNEKEIFMADGGQRSVAKRFDVDLPPDTVVYEGIYTYVDEDGKLRSETFYIFEECANPAVLAESDAEVPLQKTPPTEPVVPDLCPADGQLFDGMDKGVYRVAEQAEYVGLNGEVRLVDTSVVIADSAAEAKQMGWREARATDGYVQMFYRDENGCLQYVGCYPPDAEDKLASRGPGVRRVPDPEVGKIWDAETRDKNGELVFDKNGNGRMDSGDRVIQLRRGEEGTRMIEREFRRQGFTKFEKIA